MKMRVSITERTVAEDLGSCCSPIRTTFGNTQRVLLHKTNKTSWQFFSELRKGCYWLKRFIKLFTVELENSVHHLVEFFTLTLL